MLKKWSVTLGLVVSSLLGLMVIQALLVPKYMSGVVEGAMISEYYDEEKNHDIIFVGDCEVYGNISPMTLWEKYGVTSYIRGSAQQLVWQSYYLLEETLKYEKPDVVVFNVLALKYDTPQSEAYNRMTLDGMKWSGAKLAAIEASKLEEEHMIEYIFPLLRYHSRWNELTQEDFQYVYQREEVTHNGYYLRIDTKPAGNFPKPKKLPDYQFGDNAYKYLDKMVALCKANDIPLVLIKSPSLYPHWYEEWDQQMVDYAQKNNLQYINFLEHVEEIGIDYEVDTYDAGLHLNLTGTEKFSSYLGRILVDTYKLEDKREQAAIKAIWDEKKIQYVAMQEAQWQELETYGYLKSLSPDNKE